MKPTPAARLALAKLMLEEAKKSDTPEVIAQWENAVAQCELELATQQPVEKPE